MLHNSKLPYNGKTIAISSGDLEKIYQESSNGYDKHLGTIKTDLKLKLERKMNELSVRRAKGWSDTLEGTMKARLLAKDEREYIQEEENKRLSNEEKEYSKKQNQQLLKIAERKLFRQTPEARSIDVLFVLKI